MNQSIFAAVLLATLFGVSPSTAHAGKASLMCSPVDNIDAPDRFHFRIRNPGKGVIPAGATVAVHATMILISKADRPSGKFDFTLKDKLNPAASTLLDGNGRAKTCTATARW